MTWFDVKRAATIQSAHSVVRKVERERIREEDSSTPSDEASVPASGLSS